MVSLDFFNTHFFLRLDGQEYHWENINKFAADTNYPYCDTVGFVSYEPNRQIYHVQKQDSSEVYTGIEQPEIAWFLDNKYQLFSVINSLIEADKPVITVDMQRAQYLYDTDWIVQRHQEELLRQVPTTLSLAQFESLLNYKQELRDITQQYPKDQPAELINWPAKPF